VRRNYGIILYICGVEAVMKSRERERNGCYEGVRPKSDEVAR